MYKLTKTTKDGDILIAMFEDKPSHKHLGQSIGLAFPNEEDYITLKLVELWDKGKCIYNGIMYLLTPTKFSKEYKCSTYKKYKTLQEEEYATLDANNKRERFHLINKDIVSGRYFIHEKGFVRTYISEVEVSEFLKWLNNKDNK